MQRRRAAILYADVVGYSRLMERDEEGTHDTLRACLDVWSDIVGAHGGRIVNYAGDALLAEMPNADQALRAAVEAHAVIKQRNRDIPVDRRLRFRAGINTGSVIVDADEIYGDGVNIAARLAGRAVAGGICISETEFEELQPPSDVGFEYLGELQVHNIAKPIGAFKVLLRPEDAGRIVGRKRSPVRGAQWAVTAAATVAAVAIVVGLIVVQRPTAPDLEPATGRSTVSLLAKPAIVVLAFENLTGDPEQDYLAASISDGILAALSVFPNLSVSARPGGAPDMETGAAAERSASALTARYVLRGTLRRTADRVRVTTRLFDAAAGRYVWGGRYDTGLAALFAADDGVIDSIAAGLWAEITQSAIPPAAWRTEAAGAEAYRLAAIGLEHYRRFTRADNAEAKVFFRAAVTLDPQFVSAWAGLGWAHFNEARYGWSDDAEDSLARAAALAARVLEIDPSHTEARALQAAITQDRDRTKPVIP